MRVGDFDPGDHDADSFAGEGFLDGSGDFLGKGDEALQKFILDIKNIVDLLFWNDEGVAGTDGPDIKECDIILILEDLVSGDLSGDDLGKNSRHDSLLLE
jgi:hypothetical protein